MAFKFTHMFTYGYVLLNLMLRYDLGYSDFLFVKLNLKYDFNFYALFYTNIQSCVVI